MVNYLAKFIKDVSEITALLRLLLRSDIEWVWNPNIQGVAFEKIKAMPQTAPILKYFDSTKPIVIQRRCLTEWTWRLSDAGRLPNRICIKKFIGN